MIVMEKMPELAVGSESEAKLAVEPADISFRDLPSGVVRIRVKIRNEGEGRSRPTFMTLEAAPLGAFVPWRPLARVPVPSLEPGETREISWDAPRKRPATLGGFDRVPPTAILTAVNSSPDDSAPDPGGGLASMLDLLRNRPTRRVGGEKEDVRAPALPPDLFELLGRDQTHWAGNINVFIGAKAVERHVAHALRVYAGRTNLAMFLVGGSGRREAYAFELAGLPSTWKAALYDVTHAKTLVVDSSDTPIYEREWVTGAGALMVMLAVRPPDGCSAGDVAVQVTRKSDEKTAVVEFNLDPAAKGTGCYVA